MQALVLAGGEGTRLRPLTYTTPKPVMPLAGRPFLSFMLDWLHGHGVDEVILSCGFLSDGVKRVLGDIYDGMRLRYVVEEEPLGTAGPVRLALDEGVLEERLLVLNGDVLTDIDLTAELDQHERTGARVHARRSTRSTTRRATASCPTDDDGRVEAFLEKAEGQAPTNRINAGAYVLEREVDRVDPARAAPSRSSARCSRQLVGNGLYGYLAEGYWIDIGTPERYLEATWDLLAGRVQSKLPPRDETGSLVYEAASCRGAHVGPQSVLGRHCSVGSDSRVERSVLHDRVIVGADATVRESVLGEGVRVGERRARSGRARWSGAGAVIGDDAVVDAGARLDPGAEVDRPRARLEARRDPAHARATSSPSRTSSATRSGAPSPPASQAGPARRADRVRDGRLGDRRRPRAGRPRRPRHRARSRRCAATRSSRGPVPTASSCAPATRATPRRRWPASRRPARPAPAAWRSRPAASWPSSPARTACP